MGLSLGDQGEGASGIKVGVERLRFAHWGLKVGGSRKYAVIARFSEVPRPRPV